MHHYEILTGKWYGPDGVLWGTGWAGQDEGKNNPKLQDDPNIGPLPIGVYTIGHAYTHHKLGPVTMNLIPDPSNTMYDRSDFRVHGYGEDIEHASEGCVIQVRSVRELIESSPDRQLQVVDVYKIT